MVKPIRKGKTISGDQGCINYYATTHFLIVAHLMLKLLKTVTGHCFMKVYLANNEVVCITPDNNFYYLYVSQKTL